MSKKIKNKSEKKNPVIKDGMKVAGITNQKKKKKSHPGPLSSFFFFFYCMNIHTHIHTCILLLRVCMYITSYLGTNPLSRPDVAVLRHVPFFFSFLSVLFFLFEKKIFFFFIKFPPFTRYFRHFTDHKSNNPGTSQIGPALMRRVICGVGVTTVSFHRRGGK